MVALVPTLLRLRFPLLLGSWTDGAANTSETLVEFELPPSGTLSLAVAAGSEAAEFFVDVQREGRNATVGRTKKAGRHDAQTGALPLLPEERSVSVRLFIDNGALETYFMGGRVCLSSKMRMPSAGAVAIHVESSAPTTMKSANVWRLGSIWVTPEEVLRPSQLKTDEDSTTAAGPHVWTSPPVRIPSNMTTDAPLLGNGELGVAHGGDLASGNLTFFFAVSIDPSFNRLLTRVRSHVDAALCCRRTPSGAPRSAASPSAAFATRTSSS